MNSPTSPPPEEQSRRRSLASRIIPILLIPFAAVLLSGLAVRLALGEQGLVAEPSRPLLPMVALVIFASALIILMRLGRPTVSALLLIGVWTLIATAAMLQAGVASFLPAALLIPICAAGLLIDRPASLSLAALATLLVGSMAWLEGSGASAPIPPPDFVAPFMPWVAGGYWVGLFWTVAALTSVLAGGVQTELRRSRAQAAELERLRAQLEARVEAQGEQILAQEREAATLAERTRLAREIHDTIAQGLAGVVLQLGAVQRALAAAPAEAPEHIDMAQRMAREALAEARRSVWNLRSPALEQGDLGDALRGLVERQRGLLPRARFRQIGAPAALPPDVEAALLRVAQEGLANIAKHAGDVEAEVALSYQPGQVALTVRDAGPGFAPAQLAGGPAPQPWGGFGLVGARERLAALGGQLALSNDGGALVEARVPIGGAPAPGGEP